MKSSIILFLTLAFLFLSLESCKKKIYGCTDTFADNYSDKATHDDGSCFTQSPLVFEEQFSMTFGPSTSYNIHYPSFNYAPGDLIVLEILSDPTFNYYSPMPFISADVVLWGEYGYADGDIYIYSDLVSTGSQYFYPTNMNFGFRALLVKKKMADLNPDIKNLTIDEILELPV